MKKYYEEINIARGIAIFLVVFGHSFPDSQLGIYNNNIFYSYVVKTIYSFHMPLFFMISGFVSHKLVCISNVEEKITAVKNKFIRLMVPYLIISIPSLILKYIFSDLAYKSYNFKFGILQVLVGINPNGGLWFLYALFFISIVAIFIDKKWFKLTCIIFFLLYFIPLKDISIFTLSNVFKEGIFYFMGIIIYNNYNIIKKIIKNKYSLIISTVMLLTGSYIVILYNLNISIINLIIALTGIFMVISVSFIICNTKDKLKSVCNLLGKYSYDIYLISYFVQVPIRVILFTKLCVNYNVVLILMLIMGIIIPLVISKYFVRKIRILKICILGDYKVKRIV